MPPPSEVREAARPPTNVLPPRLLTTEPVPYPEGGRGEAEVTLELTVDAEGAARELQVVTGVEPFARAALAAARRWRFSPARVDGAARPARITITVAFAERPAEEIPASPAPPREGEPTGAGDAASATRFSAPIRPRPEPIEILIEGERPAVGKTSLSRLEIRELPGAFGDPFRAVEALPGVTPLVSGLPFYFIRGSPPGNQGYFFDGIRVPLLYHLALGPGVIHPELVERVDLYAGAYPARYGRFVGGVVAAESAPPEPTPHGHASVRLIDAGAMAHAPFADGRGTATAAGRYSYTARMLELFAPDLRLQYWDYQLRTRWQVSPRQAVEAFAFGSFDLFRQEDGDLAYRVGAEFHRLDLRFDFESRGGTRGRLAATLGTDRSRDAEGNTPNATLRDRSLGGRLDLERRWSPRLVQRGGADLALHRYDILLASTNYDLDPELARLLPTRNDVVLGGYSDVQIDVTPQVFLVAGGRLDLFTSGKHAALGVDPRIAATYVVGRDVRLTHSFGLAHQPPSFVVPVPGFDLSALETGLQRGLQASAGLELDLPAGLSSSLTLFQHVVLNGTDLLSVATRDSEDLPSLGDSGALALRSIGRTYGAELVVRRPATHRLGGFLAYTLSRSTRRAGYYKELSSFDRAHVLNAAVSVALGRQWRAGARFVGYTGLPFAGSEEPDGSAVDDVNARTGSWEIRSRPYWRLDWRLQKRWRIGRAGAWWAFTAEVLNTTLNKEEIYPSPPDGSQPAERLGPVTVPALGVEFAL